MKKLVKVVALLTVVLAMSVFMMGCSSDYGKVEKALEGINYAEIKSDSKAEAMVDQSDVSVTAHLFSNKDSLTLSEAAKINVVVVLEFKATDDMKEFINDSSTAQGLIDDIKKDGTAEEVYKALEDKGYAKGNCLIVSFNPLQEKTVRDAIKKA